MNDKQLTGNIGLFYACYRLSMYGWNVLPTIRNARGADIFLTKGKEKLGIQVKALSGEADIFLGRNYDDPSVDFWIVLMGLRSAEGPKAYIISSEAIIQGIKRCELGENSSENLIYHDTVKADEAIRYYINKKYLKNASHPHAEAWQNIGEGA